MRNTSIFRRTGPAVLCAVLMASSAACSTSAPAASGPAALPSVSPVRFIEFARLDMPVAMAVRKGDQTLYIAEQTGRLRAVRDGKVVPDPVVDLSSEVSDGNEQGLLGVAFHPDGDFLYLDWTDADGNTHVTEWAFADGKATARRDVLFQRQPYANHNGGQLAFGPDGYLYIAFGDGGSGGDPQGNGQNTGTWLGKILRIDPRGTPYRVPGDNPFVGTRGARPEIWAYGLRNPWRFSFDRKTGDLWIGDVGQNSWEEVDFAPKGKGGVNYGWNRKEGKHPFKGEAEAGTVDPVIEYPLHEGGNCSVIAGFVYRGTRIPDLAGRFLYGDFCAGWVRSVAADRPGLGEDVGRVEQLSSFGEDHEGELYALSLGGSVYRLEAGAR
ncbi:PQQ-dependent sugar dehydrogenase [Streptosporangium sp. NPDC051023]|uniref:PQQ-dependent sugar dehydrogenase n=1 Tax=Streptosporangium sp. NPDC051023 TaxID=3155410 RepID=UPI00344F1CF2